MRNQAATSPTGWMGAGPAAAAKKASAPKGSGTEAAAAGGAPGGGAAAAGAAHGAGAAAGSGAVAAAAAAAGKTAAAASAAAGVAAGAGAGAGDAAGAGANGLAASACASGDAAGLPSEERRSITLAGPAAAGAAAAAASGGAPPDAEGEAAAGGALVGVSLRSAVPAMRGRGVSRIRPGAWSRIPTQGEQRLQAYKGVQQTNAHGNMRRQRASPAAPTSLTLAQQTRQAQGGVLPPSPMRPSPCVPAPHPAGRAGRRRRWLPHPQRWLCPARCPAGWPRVQSRWGRPAPRRHRCLGSSRRAAHAPRQHPRPAWREGGEERPAAGMRRQARAEVEQLLLVVRTP